jgi:hypothetical protein
MVGDRSNLYLAYANSGNFVSFSLRKKLLQSQTGGAKYHHVTVMVAV